MKKLLFRILAKLNILLFINIKTSILVNDKKVIIPIYAGIGLGNLNLSEKWMIDVIKRLCLPAETTFIDVGVNVGQTLIKLKSVNPDIDYIGFEPNPLCVYYSELLVKANDWKNVGMVPAGIADKAQIIQLNYYSKDQTDSCASIIPSFRDEHAITRKSFCACCSSSDVELILSDKVVSAIKIDVEGAELEVIRGFVSLIQKHRPFLLVEILPSYKSDSIRLVRQQAIEQIINDVGYHSYRICKDKSDYFSHFEEVESIGVHDRMDWCDYLFSPTALK